VEYNKNHRKNNKIVKPEQKKEGEEELGIQGIIFC